MESTSSSTNTVRGYDKNQFLAADSPAHSTRLFTEEQHKILAVREDKRARPSVTVLAKQQQNTKKMHKMNTGNG